MGGTGTVCLTIGLVKHENVWINIYIVWIQTYEPEHFGGKTFVLDSIGLRFKSCSLGLFFHLHFTSPNVNGPVGCQANGPACLTGRLGTPDIFLAVPWAGASVRRTVRHGPIVISCHAGLKFDGPGLFVPGSCRAGRSIWPALAQIVREDSELCVNKLTGSIRQCKYLTWVTRALWPKW